MPTQLEERKALVRRALKGAFDEGDPEVLTELCTADFVHHTALREDVEGREAFVAFAQGLHEAFDDLSFSIESTVAEAETVAVRGAVSGVHAGDFQGIAPTQESVRWDSYVFVRLEGDAIAETWVLSDVAGLLDQLGAAPEAA